jgi:hypothetical protein
MENQDLLAPIPATAVNPIGGAVMNAIFNLFKKSPKIVKKPVEPDVRAYDVDPAVFGEELAKAHHSFNVKNELTDQALEKLNKNYNLDKPVAILSQGKFQGVKLSKEMIDDAISASKKYKQNPIDLIALMGQESTFAQQKGNDNRKLNQRDLTSGWNVDENYKPYSLDRFLADKGVPGISSVKHFGQVSYSIDDLEAVKSAIKKRPGLLEQYYKKLNATPVANENYMDMAAAFLSRKGMKGYNPGDKNYVNDVMASKALLMKDPALMKYLKSKGI